MRKTQERIPVGCVPPAFAVPGGRASGYMQGCIYPNPLDTLTPDYPTPLDKQHPRYLPPGTLHLGYPTPRRNMGPDISYPPTE